MLDHGGDAGDRHCQVRERHEGQGGHADNDFVQRGHRHWVHLQRDESASGPERLVVGGHLGNADLERVVQLHGDGDRQRRAQRDGELHVVDFELIGASADERSQTFLPGRAGTPWDGLLDCCGAITLLLVLYHLYLRLFKPRRLARAE